MHRALRSVAIAILLASSALCQVTIPPHSVVYNGFSRGYNFTAGVPFVITQLQLPPDAMVAGDTGSFLVRVNGTTALRTVGVASGSITPNLSINSGDVVDIIGNWSPAVTGNFTAHNWYTATGPFATSILGVPHTITRTGWQWDVGDPAWTSGAYIVPLAGQMGRIFMYASGGSGYASASAYGSGCYDRAQASFYQLFQPNTFNLGNNAIQMLPTGTGYVVTPGPNTWWTPLGANLGLTDDSVSGALPLGFTFNYPGGSTTSLYASSNGFVWMQANTNNGCCGGVAADLLGMGARFCPLWNDLNPGVGGTVIFDVDAPNQVAYVTWTNVPEFGGTGTNTFQVAFHANGQVDMRWQACSVQSHVILTGWSPGTGLRDPGSINILTSLPIVTSPDLSALALAAAPRPVVGNQVVLTTSNVPAATPIGAILFSVTQHNPGIDLTPLGMPGCQQYVGLDSSVVFVPSGGTGTLPINVPNNPSLSGLHVYAQSATFTAGLNALGVISSNGLDLLLGTQ